MNFYILSTYKKHDKEQITATAASFRVEPTTRVPRRDFCHLLAVPCGEPGHRKPSSPLSACCSASPLPRKAVSSQQVGASWQSLHDILFSKQALEGWHKRLHQWKGKLSTRTWCGLENLVCQAQQQHSERT